jgi:uncharacterized protein (TIGR03435 family)
MTAHPDKREMPTYAMVLARNDRRLGTALKKSDADCAGPVTAPAAPPPPGQMPRCGFMLGFGNLKARGSTLAALASSLSTFAGRIVVDQTGLAGGFDVDLTWTPDNLPRPQGGATSRSPSMAPRSIRTDRHCLRPCRNSSIEAGVHEGTR